MSIFSEFCGIFCILLLSQRAFAATDMEASYPGPWTAMYGSATSGMVTIIAAEKTSLPCHADVTTLAPGKEPETRNATIQESGHALSNGTDLGDLAEDGTIFATQPLLARWTTMTTANGVDDMSTSVPTPIDAVSPLAVRFRLLQTDQMSAIPLPRPNPGVGGGEPAPVPGFMECYWSRSTMAVTWWSKSLVSTYENRVGYWGGAHQNFETCGFTWILGTDGSWRDLHLADLFSAPDWRQTLYRLTLTDLAGQLSKPDWAAQAKDPPSDAFIDGFLKTWSLAGDGLVVHFDPYAVASFADGPFDVRIPWAKLPTLSPGFPIQELRGQP